jgi:hypothetical protein
MPILGTRLKRGRVKPEFDFDFMSPAGEALKNAIIPDIPQFFSKLKKLVTTGRAFSPEDIPERPDYGETVSDGVGGVPLPVGAPASLMSIAAWKLRHIPIEKMRKLFTKAVPEALAETQVMGSGGSPATVFHGTPGDFQEFSADALNPSSRYGPGFYFVESPSIASRYANPAYDEMRNTSALTELSNSAGPNVRAAYLNIKKPFNMDGPNVLPEDSALSVLNGNQPGRSLYRTYLDTAKARGASDVEAKKAFQGELEKAGFDGLKTITGRTPGSEAQSWVAFHPEQIFSKYDSRLKDLPKAAIPEGDLLQRSINDKDTLFYGSPVERAEKILRSGEIKGTIHTKASQGLRGVSLSRNPGIEYVAGRPVAFEFDRAATGAVPDASAEGFGKTKLTYKYSKKNDWSGYGKPTPTEVKMNPDFEYESLVEGADLPLSSGLKRIILNPEPTNSLGNGPYLKALVEKSGRDIPIDILPEGASMKTLRANDPFVTAHRKGSGLKRAARPMTEVDSFKTLEKQIYAISEDNELYNDFDKAFPGAKSATVFEHDLAKAIQQQPDNVSAALKDVAEGYKIPQWLQDKWSALLSEKLNLGTKPKKSLSDMISFDPKGKESPLEKISNDDPFEGVDHFKMSDISKAIFDHSLEAGLWHKFPKGYDNLVTSSGFEQTIAAYLSKGDELGEAIEKAANYFGLPMQLVNDYYEGLKGLKF